MPNPQEIYTTTIAPLPREQQWRLAHIILEQLRLTEERPLRQSVADILRALPKNRHYRTAAEIDASLREERDSWER
jgi:hypothetical protein